MLSKLILCQKAKRTRPMHTRLTTISRQRTKMKLSSALTLALATILTIACAKKKSKKATDQPPPAEEQKSDETAAIVSVEASADMLSTQLTDLGQELTFTMVFSKPIVSSSSETLSSFAIIDGKIEAVQYLQADQECGLINEGITVESGAIVFKSEDNTSCRDFFTNIEQNLQAQFIFTKIKAKVGEKEREVTTTLLTLNR